MGAILSTHESPNTPQPTNVTLPSPNPTPTVSSPESNHPAVEEIDQTPQSGGDVEEEIQGNSKVEREGEEDEEEGECGFCLFMKGGGCREQFVEWEKCVEEGEKNKQDIVEKCYSITSALKVCMEAHPEYYGPILMAEKAAEAKAMKELEKENEKEGEESESKVTIEMEKEGNVGDSEGKKASS